MWQNDADAIGTKKKKNDSSVTTFDETTNSSTGTTVDGNSKITLKAAVQACWPNETILDSIHLIKQGYIEVSSVSSVSSASPTTNIDSENHNHNFIWTIIRQHGKRMIYPNQYLRRRPRAKMIEDWNPSNNGSTNNRYMYEIRRVPTYPIAIAMYKPCGYIVTASTATNTTSTCTNTHTNTIKTNCTTTMLHHDSTSNEGEENDTLETLLSTSVYDLLILSRRRRNDDMSSSAEESIMDQSIEPYLSQLRAVGRLDKNTEGLLLFTNHGRWNIALTNPIVATKTTEVVSETTTKQVAAAPTTIIWKRYRCVLQNPATLHDLQYWIKGNIPFRHDKSNNGIAYSQPALSAHFVVTTSCLPHDQISAVHHLLNHNINKHTIQNHSTGTRTNDYYHHRVVDVTIGEGKYRQVRRCWESLSNNKVLYLQRLSFGPIDLIPQPPVATIPTSLTTGQNQSNMDGGGDVIPKQTTIPRQLPLLLQPGQWRCLTINELQMLEEYVHLWYRHNPNYEPKP